MDITIISDEITGCAGCCADTLAKSAKSAGHNVMVILPWYEKKYENTPIPIKNLGSYFVRIPTGSFNITLLSARINDISYMFISNKYFFSREKCQGYPDDGERSAVFSLSCLEAFRYTGSVPCHIMTLGSFCAPVTIYLKLYYRFEELYSEIRSFHYINDRKYGVFNKSLAKSVFGIDDDNLHILLCSDEINLTKAAVLCADRIFVGENGMFVLQDINSPVHHAAVQFGFKIRKLRIGIDYDIFDPEKDTVIHTNYSPSNLSGKLKNREILQANYNMAKDENIPIIALYPGRNHEIIKRILRDLLRCEMQVIIISSDSKLIHCPSVCGHGVGKAVVEHEISEKSLKNIFAGADFAVFGGFESPLGNPVYIACAYGCVPIIPSRRFFDDGISYFNKITKDGNGYTYDPRVAQDLLYTLWDAVGIYRHDPKSYFRLVSNTMKKSFSANEAVQAIEEEAKKTSRCEVNS